MGPIVRAMTGVLLVGMLVGLAPRPGCAQDGDEVIQVKMSHTGQDSLGAAVARTLQVEIEDSDDVQLVDQESQAEVLLLLQTIDPLGGTDTASYMTVYSIVLLTQSGQIIKTWIGRAGRNHVEDSAETILTTMGDYVTGATGP